MKLYMLLDASGSMGNNWKETLGAINAFVKSKNDTSIEGITVIAHDMLETMRYRVLRDNVPFKHWVNLTNEEVSPGGATPLLDAMGRMLSQIETDKPERAIVVVITDGHENASKEYKLETLRIKMETLKKMNVEFTFIGANFDAFGQANDFGVAAGSTITMNSGFFTKAFTNLRDKAEAYATAEDFTTMKAAMTYSSKERGEAAGTS